MKSILKLEELFQFILGIYLFSTLSYAWWWFLALILLPDIGMLGYLINTKIGAITYNIFHHKGLAILIFLGGIYFELQTPGVGFPIMAAIIASILYLTPYYLNGLAENWEILMFLVGIILIGIEIFIIPGFGIFGILGILFSISSLVLIMVNNDFLDFTFVFPAELFNATGSVLLAVLGFIVLLFFGGIKLSESQYFKKISLDDIQDSNKGFTSKISNNDIIGKKGKSFTVLRPSGKVIIENKIFDASTSGEYIDKNKNIEVVENEGTSIKVKQIT